MKALSILLALTVTCLANPIVDVGELGLSLGGWEHKGDQAAEYEIHGSKYRTWRPEVTSTIGGGIFVSVRVDHLRGLFSSDDYASLELEFDKKHRLVGASSKIVFQGEKQTGDIIQATAVAGSSLVGLEAAVKIGTDLITDLSSKVLRSKKNEPGRVTMPAVIRHNYNLLCLASGIVVDNGQGGSGLPTKDLKITEPKKK